MLRSSLLFQLGGNSHSTGPSSSSTYSSVSGTSLPSGVTQCRRSATSEGPGRRDPRLDQRAAGKSAPARELNVRGRPVLRRGASRTLLVEDRDAELLGLLGLGAGVLADHHVVGLLRHRARRLAAAGDDRLLDRVPGVAAPASRSPRASAPPACAAPTRRARRPSSPRRPPRSTMARCQSPARRRTTRGPRPRSSGRPRRCWPASARRRPGSRPSTRTGGQRPGGRGADVPDRQRDHDPPQRGGLGPSRLSRRRCAVGAEHPAAVAASSSSAFFAARVNSSVVSSCCP